ncbi:Cytochrome P450 monooxygenase [Podosphaera aphanis]|nr:Cytochrome P450 monooxygenase [Podosphaera aphanis]
MLVRHSVILGTLAVLAVGAFWRWFRNRSRVIHFKKEHRCEREPQLPQAERIIGYGLYRSIRLASQEGRNLSLALARYHALGNTWSAEMMGKTYINTIHPENVKTILATNFSHYGIGPRLQAFASFLGEGIFTTDGAHWERSRALVRPNLTRAHVSQLENLEFYVRKLFAKIPDDGSVVDLQPLFFQLTLDSSTKLLFGESVNSLTSEKGSEQYRFCQAFDLAQSRMLNRHRLGKFVHLFYDPEFNDACKEVHLFVDKIVSEAIKSSKLWSADEKSPYSGRYIFLMELIKSTQDPQKLRNELLNILLASRDTTASLLSNTLHVLARRPDIWQKLKQEVDAIFHGVTPDYERLRNLPYLKSVLNESLRLYPVVPVNGRFAKRNTVLPVGGGADGMSPVFVPRGSFVAYHTYAMHRQRSIYGVDAELFRPERWSPDEGLRPGWAYLPFNGGPRICVGQLYALSQASYVIARLAQEFDECLDLESGPWVEQLSLTLCPAGGVKVRLVKKRPLT